MCCGVLWCYGELMCCEEYFVVRKQDAAWALCQLRGQRREGAIKFTVLTIKLPEKVQQSSAGEEESDGLQVQPMRLQTLRCRI
jgi:hypothetical protein